MTNQWPLSLYVKICIIKTKTGQASSRYAAIQTNILQ